MDQPKPGYRTDEPLDDRKDERLEGRLEDRVDERAYAPPHAGQPPRRYSEDVQRVQVEEEDRLAFRVGVNILTLLLIGLAAYLVWRNFFQ